MKPSAPLFSDIPRHSALGDVIASLDRWGVTVSNTRISAFTVLVAILALIVAVILARLANRLACILIGKIGTLDNTQRLLAQKLVSLLVWALTILLLIDFLGINLTALTVFSGAFGLAVGFGLQKTFGNLLAEIILLMDRSIKPGDVIAVNDGHASTVGQVKKIGIRAVSVTTRDKIEYLIPNEILMTSQVENWSYSSRDVRIKVPVGVAYGTDIELAEKLMLEAARQTRRVLGTPAPSIWLNALGNDAIEFVAQLWIDDPEDGVGNVRSDYLKNVLRLFLANQVEIPFPQRDVNLRDNPALRDLIAALHAQPPG